MSCRYLQVVGYEEYRCGITGASMGGDCGLSLDGWCVPRLALRYLAGTLDHFRAIDERTREAIIMTAEQITERRSGGQAPKSRLVGTGAAVRDLAALQPANNSGAGAPGPTLHGLSLGELTDKELEALQARILERRRALRRQRACLAPMKRRLAKLVSQRQALDARITALAGDVNAIEEGRVAAEGSGRRVEGSKASGASGWTPERRAKQAETAKRLRAEGKFGHRRHAAAAA